MIYHILNGDSLAFTFRETKIVGEVVVTREALIDGSLKGNSLEEFWKTRAKYLDITENEYNENSTREFEKIIKATDGAEFNLWFEYDLFCQVNMWFVLSLIEKLPVNKKVYAVYTSHLDRTDKNFWNGFGPAPVGELELCFKNRILFTDADIEFGNRLWIEYKNSNFENLNALSQKESPAYPYINEVIQAHIDRFPGNGEKGRPEKIIEDILKTTAPEFNSVFREFWKRESIYGFGDTQFKTIYDRAIQ